MHSLGSSTRQIEPILRELTFDACHRLNSGIRKVRRLTIDEALASSKAKSKSTAYLHLATYQIGSKPTSSQ